MNPTRWKTKNRGKLIGDRRAERVDLRVDFEHTGMPHLIVYWRRSGITEAEKAEWIRRAAALGPF
jgi:hypothetical protein